MRKKGNICKFVTTVNDDRINALSFVYEQDEKNLETEGAKNHNAMYIILNGTGSFFSCGIEKSLKQGTLFFTFSEVPFRIKNIKDLQYIYITFTGGRCRKLFERFKISQTNCVFEGYENIISFWQNSLSKATEQNLDLISESVLLYTFSEILPPDDNSSVRLADEVIKYINSNFTDSSLTLDFAAENLGYSPKYVSRTFKKNIGTTFSEYLKNTRIQHAIFLIEQGVTSVKNVAFLSGYSNPFYFSNVFKQKLGMSPKEFIEKKGASQ